MYSNAFSGTSLIQVNINSNAIASQNRTSTSSLQTIFGNNVTHYTFGQDVTTIGDCALYGCSSIQTVSISNSVSTIGDSAFEGCTSLQSIVLPNSLTTISNALFKNCTNLQQVTIPSSVTTIKNMAFSGCNHLNRINITDMTAWCGINYETYFGYAYSQSYSLYLNGSSVTNLTIPNGVTTINDIAFAGCTSITSVTIPSVVNSIGNSAFAGCINLTRVNISNLGAWCNITFANAEANPLYQAHHLYLNGNLVTNLNLGSSTPIGDFAFVGCLDFTELTIPSTVTSIGSSAFVGCSNMTSVSIPSTVNTIGSSAFADCTSLTRVNISNLGAWCQISFGSPSSNPLYYAHELYLNNARVTNLNNASGATSIGSYAFYGCTSLSTANIPTSVQSIGNQAFTGCTGLTSVTIFSSVQSIGNYAFNGCPNLTSVTINSNAVASANYSSSSNFLTRFGNQVTTYTLGRDCHRCIRLLQLLQHDGSDLQRPRVLNRLLCILPLHRTEPHQHQQLGCLVPD